MCGQVLYDWEPDFQVFWGANICLDKKIVVIDFPQGEIVPEFGQPLSDCLAAGGGEKSHPWYQLLSKGHSSTEDIPQTSQRNLFRFENTLSVNPLLSDINTHPPFGATASVSYQADYFRMLSKSPYQGFSVIRIRISTLCSDLTCPKPPIVLQNSLWILIMRPCLMQSLFWSQPIWLWCWSPDDAIPKPFVYSLKWGLAHF